MLVIFQDILLNPKFIYFTIYKKIQWQETKHLHSQPNHNPPTNDREVINIGHS